jgi:hypothetical protein
MNTNKSSEGTAKNALLRTFCAAGALEQAVREPRVTAQSDLSYPPAEPPCRQPKHGIGILVYGSLITDPGAEIAPRIKLRLQTTTPFPVEFGRYGKKRDGAPTVISHDAVVPVAAQILVLNGTVTFEQARNMLWRREAGVADTSKSYPACTGPNSVQVEKIKDNPCVTQVLFTDFLPAGKIENPNDAERAQHAIASVKTAEAGQDGISYLIGILAPGVNTPLTAGYEVEILKQAKAQSLQDALRAAKGSGGI